MSWWWGIHVERLSFTIRTNKGALMENHPPGLIAWLPSASIFNQKHPWKKIFIRLLCNMWADALEKGWKSCRNFLSFTWALAENADDAEWNKKELGDFYAKWSLTRNREISANLWSLENLFKFMKFQKIFFEFIGILIFFSFLYLVHLIRISSFIERPSSEIFFQFVVKLFFANFQEN